MTDHKVLEDECNALRRQRWLLLVVTAILVLLLLAGCWYTQSSQLPRIAAESDSQELIFPDVPSGASASEKLVFAFDCQSSKNCLFSNLIEGATPKWSLEGAQPEAFAVSLLRRDTNKPPYGLKVTFTPKAAGQSTATLKLAHPTLTALTTAVELRGKSNAPPPLPIAAHIPFATGSSNFDSATTECDNDSRQELSRWMDLPGDLSQFAVLLVGHADFRGSEASNQRLAHRRACFVAGELERAGLRRQRLLVIPAGEAASRVQRHADSRGLCPDRRVDLVLVPWSDAKTLRSVSCEN